ncbi:MAG: hypothetical protein M3O25_00600 [Actinomycetota bacterium]|nr:hypothetical protein [Actinomycetota bacterium]
MTPLALTWVIGALWVIGLIIGLVALIMITGLLSSILNSARKVAVDAGDAYDSTEIMSGGVRGVDGLSETNDLANQVPGLTDAYLAKLRRGGSQ